MVYCSSCGAKNPDDARICAQCGEPLYFEEVEPTQRRTQRSSDLCYDVDETTGRKRLSQRGIIIIGGLILLWGLNQVIDVWFPEMSSSVWPVAIFTVGIIIILYALFVYGRES